MGVSSGRTRVTDLAFRVFGSVLHPDWFTVRAHRRFVQAGWEADVRIVEGGHVIVWSSDLVRLTEVLSGPDTELPERGLLFHSHVRHERTAKLQPSSRVDYQTCFDVERIDTEVFNHLTNELTLDGAKGGMFHRFSPTNRLAPSPVCHLHIESRPRGLLVQAFHTFPDERAIVRTQTLFEIRNGKTR
ncbi:MAG TPA: DUF2617 family protein [Isosphaeraceae bacterium]|jgi:hypothetical protein|nr:DUF2617 family protein [Isosphaeraceae bacterium]